MPQFKLDIEKYYNGEYWTNRYIVEAIDLTDAATDGDAILASERPMHLPVVLFTKWRLSDFNPTTDEFIVKPVNLAGTRTGFGGEPLALFNTVRVDFPAGFGRPSRKYYRGCLTEGDIIGPNLIAGTVTYMQERVSTLTSAALVDPQGTLLGEGVVKTLLQMRQLRRGTKRRTQPIL